MEISYRRELEHNYLILEQENYEENYQTEMITKNKIPGLLECRLSRLNQRASLCYEITSKQNLRLVLERKRLSEYELRSLLEGIRTAARSCGEYLLEPRFLILDPEFLYLDPDEWNFLFCFFPQEEEGYSLFSLAEYLLDHLDRQDPGAVTLGYEFYREAGEENPSLDRLLEKHTEEYTCEKIRGKEDSVQEKFPEWSEQKAGETACLIRAHDPGLFLRSESGGCPDLRITEESFLIGKKRDAVDGWLKVRGISRIHCKISRENDCFYITDLNSTNGTFLNGGRLEVNEKAVLHPGDRVRFADTGYIVEG